MALQIPFATKQAHFVTSQAFFVVKKSAFFANVNLHIAVEIRHLFDSPMDVQADEQWGYVGNKKNQRWLWYAIDAMTGRVLSFVFGRRQDAVCGQLISNLKAFTIQTYYTDDWGSYSALIPKDKHVIGKQ
jgi:insertion element IS1 protein InsB